MDLALVLVLQVLFQPALSAVLFTVVAEQSLYESEFGGNVELGCSFQPKLSSPHADLKVTWNRIPSASAGHIYLMDNGKELTDSQDPDYRGRVKLLKQELNNGLAKLQISRLRINDSGKYQCLVETSEGADYKAITLSVKAPYRDVTKHIGKSEEDEVLLSCQSKGYPESSVVWQDGNMQRLNANTTAVSTSEQLFIVTSQIRVKSSDKNNYTCSFTKDSYSATFKIPDDFSASHERSDAVIIILCLALMVAVITVSVLMYLRMYRRKGCRNAGTSNLCVNGGGRNVLPAFCLQIQRENEEETITFNEGSMEEKLGAFLKAHYLNLPFTQRPRQYWEAFGVEVLPHRLQNNEGQPVNLQTLLPEVGGTLLLEGAPGSGKTTLAKILVSSWTEGPGHAFPNLLDLSAVQLLLYMDCSRAKSDLFQEMMTQLQTEKISKEEELRTVLTRSKEALLLLDGYKEGEPIFDESLRRFLNEPGGCRVLVIACTGHCDKLKEKVGTGQVVELQTDTDTLS